MEVAEDDIRKTIDLNMMSHFWVRPFLFLSTGYFSQKIKMLMYNIC